MYNAAERTVEVEYVTLDLDMGTSTMVDHDDHSDSSPVSGISEYDFMPTVHLRAWSSPLSRLSLDRVGSSAFHRSGVLSGRILTEADTKAAGGRWDPNVSVISEALQKRYMPMLPTLRELKELLVSPTT